MSAATRALFVVSSGRSGTAMLHKALAAAGNVDMHHEYMVQIVQPLAVKRYMGWIGPQEAQDTLRETYGAAIHYSTGELWGDSSNKASWLIPDLAAVVPEARFVHLVRDGRKVAGSYFRKLHAECYDDRSTAIFSAYARDRSLPPPPPEKKYWWPVPNAASAGTVPFDRFDQFERIAWHWAEINRVILQSLADIAPERQRFVRLEELQAHADAVADLFGFLGVPFRPELAQLFARPHNVNRPEDHLLDAHRRRQFDAIAQTMMQRLGYAQTPEYVVNY